MIKGVNKRILEIRPRYGDKFERIIIILSNESDITDEEELIKNALMMSGNLPAQNIFGRNRIKLLASGIFGSILTLCCFAIMLLFV